MLWLDGTAAVWLCVGASPAAWLERVGAEPAKNKWAAVLVRLINESIILLEASTYPHLCVYQGICVCTYVCRGTGPTVSVEFADTASGQHSSHHGELGTRLSMPVRLENWKHVLLTPLCTLLLWRPSDLKLLERLWTETKPASP
jgi:hypothetical protein